MPELRDLKDDDLQGLTLEAVRPSRSNCSSACAVRTEIRPWALGRKAWLFAGSELAGQRAAVVMSLVQSAKINSHDPHANLNDVLTRLPTHLKSRIDELLPHNWQPTR